MRYNAGFHGSKNGIFRLIICDSLFIFAPNMDCGCLLESPQQKKF